jgi:hypothetical protein
MSSKTSVAAPEPSTPKVKQLLEQYGCGPIHLTGTDDALYERHLTFDSVVDATAVGPCERYEAATHLADLTAYLEADRQLLELYGAPDAWASKVVRNIASSGRFSSDRTIAKYAAEIWDAKPCPVV